MAIDEVRIDRRDDRSYVDQLCDAIRNAVARGELKEGERLPGIRELAGKLGASLKVPREAFGRLQREGLLSARRGLGTVVCGRSSGGVRRRVLILHQETHGAFVMNYVFERLEMWLTGEGYSVSRIAVPYRGGDGPEVFRSVRDFVRRGAFDCAFAQLYQDEGFALLKEAGIPFVAYSLYPKRYPGASGTMLGSNRKVLNRIVAECRRKKIRRVLQMSQVFDVLDLREALTGIEVETVVLPKTDWQGGGRMELQCRAYEAMSDRLRRMDLPDAVFLLDDYVARGALVAIANSGIRVPDELRVVSWSNRGDDVFFRPRLTTLSFDAHKAAEEISGAFLKYLQTGRLPSGLVFGPEFIPGDSF